MKRLLRMKRTDEQGKRLNELAARNALVFVEMKKFRKENGFIKMIRESM